VALFAALLTKVGVYALIRLFTLVFPLADSGYQPVLVAAAALTMLTGVLAAASQGAVRRILSFHIISQIGYMVMGLAVFTPLSMAGAVFYLVHHIIVKANLFLIGGVLLHRHGSDGLSRLGGSFRRQPVLAALFLIPALSLAGIPPLSGFWGKFIVIRAGLETGYYLLSATALVVGLLTLYSMTKIWAGAFWKPAPADQTDRPPSTRNRLLMYAPITALAALTITIGLAPEPFVQVAERAAAELMDPSAYIRAVLGRAP
jgi:multicomponent Na+:H+ antiporter subunit D